MQSNFDRRIRRIEKLADDVLTHREYAELALALFGMFKAAMVEHIGDPALLWEVLTEMTGDANRVLEPTGFAIGWRMP
jgi:hypothetical protein